MKFTIEIPDAAGIITGGAKTNDFLPRIIAHRIHHRNFGSTAFNDTNKGNARFSPIRDVMGQIIPTIYAAQDFDCAASEIILRSPETPPSVASKKPHIVAPSDYTDYLHSRIILKPGLELLDLTIEGQRQIGVHHNALLAGPRSTYSATRSWAEAIHRNFPDVQGIYYHSYQLAPRWAVVLFGDRIRPSDIVQNSSRSVGVDPCHSEIVALANRLGIHYIDV